jgi:hypothetical protein
MSMKGWLLGKVHGPSARGSGDGRVAPSLRDAGDVVDAPAMAPDARGGERGTNAHLGLYAPLVAAIREELEQFVASQLGLHLAIAERDRYVLTSIEVACDDESAASLLRRFTAEFTPEQVKRFLARDVIAALRNASAIDLAQFAGLQIARPAAPVAAADPYADLIAELKGGGTGDAGAAAFAVTLHGRWVHGDAAPATGADARGGTARLARGTTTPLASRTLVVDVEDARGARRLELAPIVPGRRYIVGKDEGCDVVVEGTYASRRHCELWFDQDRWWVIDAGSTNGIRVESGGAEARSVAQDADRVGALEVPAGALVVLSALAHGDPRHYPRLRLAVVTEAGEPARPPSADARRTPVTPIAPTRRHGEPILVAVRMASGRREIDLAECALPFGIGRSRNQSLVIDGAHTDVSGRHVEIVSVDDDGALVIVHGDNGVVVESVRRGVGARFVWKRGETMQLGHGDADTPPCTVTLAPRS